MKTIIILIAILFVGCEKRDILKDVHVDIYYDIDSTQETFSADLNALAIYDDRIELWKAVMDKSGNVKKRCMVWEKSEYDSIKVTQL